jgi:CelD/BcsL family acetyltransferase involved in cellulose biosynthesis
MPVVTDLGRLDRLAGVWDELAHRLQSPVQSYQWARAWVEAFSHRYDIHVVTVGPTDRPFGIAPLVRKLGGLDVEQLGGHDPREPADLLFTDERAAEDLALALAALGRPLVLQRLPARSPAVPALRRAFRSRGLLVVRPQPSSPFIRLDETWLEPERNFNVGRRSDFRRAYRIAETSGPVRTEIHDPNAEEVQPLLAEALAVEEAGWKGRAGTALSKDRSLRDFYTRYASLAASEGILRIAFLRIGDRQVAMQLAVESHRRFWLLKIGYDENFARCSPGTLLMLHTVRYAAEKGLASYEFLGTEEPWTRMWTRLGHPTVSVRAYPAGVPGARALAADAIQYVRRRAFRSDSQSMLMSRSSRTQEARSIRSSIRLASPMDGAIRPALRAVATRPALRYAAGAGLGAVIPLCRELQQRGFASAIGYWNRWEEEPAAVAGVYLQTVECIDGEGWKAYISMKAPALGFERELVDRVVARSCDLGVGVHFDALWPEAADATLELMERVAPSGTALGCTLPAVWRRSLADADRAVEAGWRIRLVKGQWRETVRFQEDPRVGFMGLVDRLAGRGSHVAVATHDGSLAFEALRRLVTAGTPCELELLMGLPPGPALEAARSLQLPVRVYVPFGHPELPYRRELRRKPIAWWWLCRDLLAARRNGSVPAKLRGLR